MKSVNSNLSSKYADKHNFAAAAFEAACKEASKSFRKIGQRYLVDGEIIAPVGHDTIKGDVVINMFEKEERIGRYFYTNPKNHDMVMFIDHDKLFAGIDSRTIKYRFSDSKDILKNQNFIGLHIFPSELEKIGAISKSL